MPCASAADYPSKPDARASWNCHHITLVYAAQLVAKRRMLPEAEAGAGITAATTDRVTTGIEVKSRSRSAL